MTSIPAAPNRWAAVALVACALVAGPAAGGSAGGVFAPLSPLAGAKPWTATPADDGGPLRFAVIGDRTGVARPGVFPQAMKQIAWLAPDFVIPVGDLIEGYEDDPAKVGREWDEFDGFLKPLNRPFIFVPGNHDLTNATELAIWEARHGPPYYGFLYKHALFLVLDTEDPPMPVAAAGAASFHALVELMNRDPEAGDQEVEQTYFKRPPPAIETDVHFSDAQVDFVRKALAAHKDVRWTFVFFHKPAWNSDSANWRRIETLLADRPYTVFAGHLHYYDHTVRGGHDYFDMATTGAIAHRAGPGTMDHTLLVTLTPKGPSYANIRLNGLSDADNQTGQVRAH
jgi:3',5'-cyclic AMP phosphodiesterase CpdA